MACCVGLKRPRPDLDPINSSPNLIPKRRRPLITGSPTSSGSSGGNLPVALQQEHQKLIFSSYGDTSVPELRSDAIANQIREEMKRFQNRRQLNFSNNDCNQAQPSATPGWPPVAVGFAVPQDLATDKPLFTFDQVHQICGRMLQDRENVLREYFQKILTSKLDEQYETFVKFAHDQLKGLSVSSDAACEEPSYLS